MSTLVEIATKADVAVEGVVRVLTKRPVSAAVSERVLAVLGQLDAQQAQVVQRFALASIPDVLPMAAAPASVPDVPRRPAEAAGLQLEASLEDAAAALAHSEPHPVRSADASADEAELVAQLGTFLQELVDTLTQLQGDGATLRQERTTDLAVLVDLITSCWQGVDRRLGRLEQMVARLEPAQR